MFDILIRTLLPKAVGLAVGTAIDSATDPEKIRCRAEALQEERRARSERASFFGAVLIAMAVLVTVGMLDQVTSAASSGPSGSWVPWFFGCVIVIPFIGVPLLLKGLELLVTSAPNSRTKRTTDQRRPEPLLLDPKQALFVPSGDGGMDRKNAPMSFQEASDLARRQAVLLQEDVYVLRGNHDLYVISEASDVDGRQVVLRVCAPKPSSSAV